MCAQFTRFSLLSINTLLFIALTLVGSTAELALGQAAGARGGRVEAAREENELDRREANSHITVEAKVEERLEPTELRIVFALLSDGETAIECQQQIKQQERQLREALQELGIEGQEAIVTDFISVLPMYEWNIKNQEGESVAIEEASGYRMQTNIHVKATSDKQALAVLQEAFELGLTEVIAFDYWSGQIDTAKQQVRRKALEAAREKAEYLLGNMFEEMPNLINVQTDTRAIYPRSKYESFQSTQTESFEPPPPAPGEERMPQIEATKPTNTYYRGFDEQTDLRAEGLPMTPQISVVSTVRLYYATPKAARYEP